jgi:hypothetical protein
MERPLSQFMFPTWYRFQITLLLSILHRFTGIALAVGSILFAWGLVAVATGDVFAATQAFIFLRERRRHRNPRFGGRQWASGKQAACSPPQHRQSIWDIPSLIKTGIT